jgi:hypothetical protein
MLSSFAAAVRLRGSGKYILLRGVIHLVAAQANGSGSSGEHLGIPRCLRRRSTWQRMHFLRCRNHPSSFILHPLVKQ